VVVLRGQIFKLVRGRFERSLGSVCSLHSKVLRTYPEPEPAL